MTDRLTRDRTYYAENRDKVLAKAAARYRANKDRYRAAAKAHRARDADVINKRSRDKYAIDPEYKDKKKTRAMDWITRNYRSWLLRQVKLRAKKCGIPFDLTIDDIVIPEFCPVLGLKLERGVGSSCDTSPTVDRIIASKGYVKGNVAVMSRKANSMKGGASAAEHRRIAEWMESMTNV